MATQLATAAGVAQQAHLAQRGQPAGFALEHVHPSGRPVRGHDREAADLPEPAPHPVPPRDELVGGAEHEHPVQPPLHDGGLTAPPRRVDEHERRRPGEPRRRGRRRRGPPPTGRSAAFAPRRAGRGRSRWRTGRGGRRRVPPRPGRSAPGNGRRRRSCRGGDGRPPRARRSQAGHPRLHPGQEVRPGGLARGVHPVHGHPDRPGAPPAHHPQAARQGAAAGVAHGTDVPAGRAVAGDARRCDGRASSPAPRGWSPRRAGRPRRGPVPGPAIPS